MTVRGCDSRYWYPVNETIPDNGCTYRSDGLLWCWCKFGDLCNVFSELLLATLGGNNPCYYNPCQNNGICYLFSTSNLRYACYCQPTFTGRSKTSTVKILALWLWLSVPCLATVLCVWACLSPYRNLRRILKTVR